VKAQRRGRIDHEIQRAIAKIVAENVKDPRMGFVTITRCEITSDMKQCKVYFSVIGDRHVAKQTLEALLSAKGFIRGELGNLVELRHTPDLTFVEDRSAERAIELNRTLDAVGKMTRE
jgi:ribosome-binding factor A